jgi:hypothetical protein
MRRLLLASCCAAFLAGCAKSDTEVAADSAAPASSMVAAPAAVSLADVAGKWNVQVMGESSDSVLTTYVLDAKGEPAGWTLTFPNREPIPMTNVVAAGDSIVTDAGPFDSAVRSGAKVTNVRSVVRMQGGNMVGTAIARYETTGPDSVARLRLQGTRAP